MLYDTYQFWAELARKIVSYILLLLSLQYGFNYVNSQWLSLTILKQSIMRPSVIQNDLIEEYARIFLRLKGAHRCQAKYRITHNDV